jgi:hypothetical protein
MGPKRVVLQLCNLGISETKTKGMRIQGMVENSYSLLNSTKLNILDVKYVLE